MELAFEISSHAPTGWVYRVPAMVRNRQQTSVGLSDSLVSMPKLWRWKSMVSPSIVPSGISPSEFVLSPVWCSRPTTGVLLAPCHDEFCGPRSDYVRQVALETTLATVILNLINFDSHFRNR
ncbi:hypothetical protein TNCV_2607881 [Trichonephila clavipes]|uniref:Uncharacterized protein n=1 Tax=Trichonephila clavipes TaxID=2585209 RepID=A0A8X6RV23_TRICX|nr:hypothetical protein TNCV_2607881 [Trichonephila clavipes]